MKIDQVRIAGFRGIKDLEISLSKQTVLLGMNNSGKTSFLKALELALGDYGRRLSEDDLFISGADQVAEILVDVLLKPNDGLVFGEIWQDAVVSGAIQQEASGQSFIALRTIATPDLFKGGFKIERYHLEEWNSENWKEITHKRSNRLLGRFPGISFMAMDAQRDIQKELQDRYSYVGKVLSGIKYDESDTKAIERLIDKVNQTAIEKSQPLQSLKDTLDDLTKSFNGQGKTELTPIPKNLRDLAKKFSIQFGEGNASFSMEYHGMGTRSWASLLSGRAFLEIAQKIAQDEDEAFFPILAIEEPEAHLHPNAQKTLYNQFKSITTQGQVLLSTHSPYIAGQADVFELRYLQKDNDGVKVSQLRKIWKKDSLRKLKREVIYSKGELLFSRALVLTEGEAEEQALPILFSHYFEEQAFEMGVNFVGVSGKGARYVPFLQFAYDLNIPVFIFSDGEANVIGGSDGLVRKYESVYGENSYDNNLDKKIFVLDGTNFEGYLISKDLLPTYEKLVQSLNPGKWEQYLADKDQGNEPVAKVIKRIVDKAKPQYAVAIAEEICKLEKEKFPDKFKNLFDQIKNTLDV